MSIITQNSRIAHHRFSNTAIIPTVPSSEDFTDGTWLYTDLALGEIGINLNDDRIWFRTDNGIIELQTLSGSSLLWERDGDDIRAVEDAVSTPVVYPNILPVSDGNGQLGSSADKWAELWVANDEQILEVSKSAVGIKGIPGILLNTTTTGSRVWIENVQGSNATSIELTSTTASIDAESTIVLALGGATYYELDVYSAGLEFYDVNDSLIAVSTGSFAFATDGTNTLAESYIVGSTTDMTINVLSGANMAQILMSADSISIYNGTGTELNVDGNEIRGIATVYTMGTRTGSEGTASFVEGGSGGANTASGLNSHAEGSSNTASGPASHVEGTNNIASGNYSHAEGSGTTASGHLSHAQGGSTVSQGEQSFATGYNTIAKRTSENAYGTSPSANGSHQHGHLQYQRNTSNASATEMFLDLSNAERFTIASGETYRCEIYALAVDTGTGDSKEWSGAAIIKNVGGTTSLVTGSAIASALADASMATATLAMTADNTNDALAFTATGIAATNIRWNVTVYYTKIGY